MTTDDLLVGWKAIADYLHVSVRTAQRWAEASALPVKHPAGPETTPMARKGEIDLWIDGRGQS